MLRGLLCLEGWGCCPCWCGGVWDAGTETPWHGDSAWVELTCGQCSNEGGEVGPAHREVAGKDLTEAIFELGLDESNYRIRHVLMYCRLCLEEVVDLGCCFNESR